MFYITKHQSCFSYLLWVRIILLLPEMITVLYRVTQKKLVEANAYIHDTAVFHIIDSLNSLRLILFEL